MKLLILGSVALPVPPPMQGGTERIAYWQAVGLAKRGHEVTLVAARGSKADPAYRLVEIGGGDTVVGSSANLPEVANKNLDPSSVSDTSTPSSQTQRESEAGQNFVRSPAGSLNQSVNFTEGSRNMRKELVYMAQVAQWLIDNKDSYDVIVNNMRGGESTLLPVVKFLGKKFVTVMHLPIFRELADLFVSYKTSVITISNAQRADFPDLNYVGMVYNATDLEELPFVATADDYLVMMGSVAPHKNQKDGILAAKALGKKIVLAGKIGNMDYWNNEIKPLVDGTMVVHKGEMSMEEKAALLGHATALLFPIVWPEPFGLVMIEAMATGTPVVAYRNGAIPEVIKDGMTGFVINASAGVDGLVEAVKKISTIDRVFCRKYVEDNFTVEKMIESLEAAVEKVAIR